MQETVPFNRRVYGVLQPQDDGLVLLKLSLTPPNYNDPAAVLLLRGVLPMGNDITVELVSDPTKDDDLRGPPGADATDAQIAAAIAAYLIAHPPAAGKDGATPTVAIGKVTTLAAGATATVKNSGTAAAVVLDIGIPAGAIGAQGPAVTTALGSITFGETATIAIQAGVRQLLASCAGVKAGDAIILAPSAALPAGYLLGHAVASADGQLQIALIVPLIAIGAKYSITARVLRVG